VGGQGEVESVALTDEAVRNAECVVIVTDPRVFDYTKLATTARLIVDTRNAMKRATANGGRVVKL
jgi:UDP-N-acetyl-D-glucosamine dehydrogenase